MKLNTFLIAEAATAHEGQLYIHAGGLTNIAPPSLPWIHPQLALVLRVEVEPEDDGRDHAIEIRFRDPHGVEPVPTISVPLPASDLPERLPERPIFAIASLTVASVPIVYPGSHAFVVAINGEEAGVERVWVLQPED